MGTFLLYLVSSLPLVGAYILLGMGITVIYQASRVLNLAHGAMAMLGAYTTYQVSRAAHVPLVVSVLCGVLMGAALGLLVERVFIRRLRPAGPTTQTVGTVAVLTFAIAIAARIWGSLPLESPSVLPATILPVGSGTVSWQQLGIFPIGLAGAALLFALFKFTDVGLAMRGAAQNRRGAALRGVDPNLTSAAAWAIGGALAGLTGILLAGATALDPFNLSLGVLPAFVAALIGGLESMPGVCIGAAIIGITQGMVPWVGVVFPRIGGIVQSQGAPELVLGVLALVVMATRGARLATGDVRSDTLDAAGEDERQPSAEKAKGMPRGRGVALAVGLTAILVWPVLPHIPYDLLNTAVLACEYSIAALSLVLLIGLVGQISLCQAALIGMGAFVGAIGVQRFGLEFPWTLGVGLLAGAATATLIGVVALRVRGLYLAVATLIFAYVCDQYLFAQPWLVQSRSGTSIPFESVGRPGTIPFFDLGDAHVFYYFALALAGVAVYAVVNLRDSRIGRAFAAIRGSEVAAASLGIAVTRFKLLGFASAGALAGLGGALTLIGSRTVAPEQFNFTNSLYFLAIAVVGGLRSIGGAIASALLFAVLVGEVFFRFPRLADYLDVVSAGLLIAVLLFFRGGLGAVPDTVTRLVARLRSRAAAAAAKLPRPRRERDGDDGGETAPLPRPLFAPAVLRLVRPAATARRLFSRPQPALSMGTAAGSGAAPVDVVGLARRARGEDDPPHAPALHVEHPASATVPVQDAIAGGPTPTRPDALTSLRNAMRDGGQVAGEEGPGGRRTPVLLAAEGITVQFGGLRAVSDASLQVGAGEIVGLIGPNGAGKTTLFNSILGLNQPTAGRVFLFDHEVTTWDVHRRAALGLGRTFQILQLFGDLTVFDNLLVATHLQSRTGLAGSLFVTSRAKRSESAARERVQAVLELMDLEQYAGKRVVGLPFGVLRLVEVARTLVTGARLVCFDEPASGLDSAETERLIEWFRMLRQMGITLLVIEHDVDMVVRLCDWIYVLDQGRLIASAPPAQIQRDPAVIASYLGAPAEVA